MQKLSLTQRLSRQLRTSRMVLLTMMPVTMLAAASGGLMDTIQPALRLIYIMLGFSLIIFLHELGHFVVARLCSVKCLAFSLGIGPRMLGWRSGGKLSFGKDPWDPDKLKGQSPAQGKTLGEIEDEKNALKSPDDVTISTEKGPVKIQPDTKNLTGDILGKPHERSTIEKAEAATTHSDLLQRSDEPKHPKAIGDCDYRISWLPLGGYVRMLGQDDMDPTKVSSDPNAFNRRPIWQRMCIVSAGVIMNLIFAAVCFSIIFSPGIGVDFPPANVGIVSTNMPAFGHLHMGDEILSINDERPRGFLEFTDVMMASALSNGSEEFTLHVRPWGGSADGKSDYDVKLLPKRSESTGFLAFGIEPMTGLKIGGDGASYTNADADAAYGHRLTYVRNKPELAKIKQGDKIVAVDDIDLRDPEPKATHNKYVVLYKHIQEMDGKPVVLTLENTVSKAQQKITLYPELEVMPGDSQYPAVLGLSPQIVIGEPFPKSAAAEAELKDGDRIVSIGERSDPDMDTFRSIVQSSDGKVLNVTVERQEKSPATGSASSATQTVDGARTIAKVIAARKDGKSGKYVLGVPLMQDVMTTRFITPPRDTEAGSLGLSFASTISAVGDVAVGSWDEIYAQLRTKHAGEKVKVTFMPGDGTASVQHEFTMTEADEKAVMEHLQFSLGLSLANETKTQVAKNAGEAFMMGMDHTKKFILNVYMTLAGLARRTVDPSNLHGIVGITKVGYDVQERGPVWLWYVLAMVSVNLAVANFLPLPIVDGGLFLLLILEKIRGKPLSLKVQSAIQTVGIILLAGLFIFVTYNDIGLFRK